MKNIFKTGALVLGAAVLSAFAFVSANDITTEDLSANANNSTELLALNTVDFDGKCGEGKCGEGKKSEKKEGAKKSEGKEEHKCGEGKCGEGKKSEKKGKKSEEKKEEHKCGEGKCGGQ